MKSAAGLESDPQVKLPDAVVKSKQPPIKWSFPVFGRAQDEQDQYIVKCKDFLALQPLTDVEIVATFEKCSIWYCTRLVGDCSVSDKKCGVF